MKIEVHKCIKCGIEIDVGIEFITEYWVCPFCNTTQPSLKSMEKQGYKKITRNNVFKWQAGRGNLKVT